MNTLDTLRYSLHWLVEARLLDLSWCWHSKLSVLLALDFAVAISWNWTMYSDVSKIHIWVLWYKWCYETCIDAINGIDEHCLTVWSSLRPVPDQELA